MLGGTIASSDVSGTITLGQQSFVKDFLLEYSADNEYFFPDLEIYSSEDATPEMYREALKEIVIESRKTKFDGILITHGTDTCAIFAQLAYRVLSILGIPFVITGAIKSPDKDPEESAYNLLFAIGCIEKGTSGVVFRNSDRIPSLYKAYAITSPDLDGIYKECKDCVEPEIKDRIDFLTRDKLPRVLVIPAFPGAVIPEDGFDRVKLAEILRGTQLLGLADMQLCAIGKDEFEQCLASDWAYSFVSNFSDYNEFEEHGFGFVIKHGGSIVSGTSTYCYYSRGVEVEVSTAPQYRMKGLARITAARFIAECIDRGLAPNWDARNMASVKIARKLGFALHDTYTAYEFRTPQELSMLPKDKFDSEAVKRLSGLDDEQIEPIVPQLLEWIQDMNWPVAQLVCELLNEHYSVVEPQLYELLKPGQTDDIWKYNIIKYLIGGRCGRPNDERLMTEIMRIAQHPTDSEKAELVDQAAKEFLKDPA